MLNQTLSLALSLAVLQLYVAITVAGSTSSISLAVLQQGEAARRLTAWTTLSLAVLQHAEAGDWWAIGLLTLSLAVLQQGYTDPGRDDRGS